MENCVFCNVIAGIIPSQKVYEDDKTVAILDINPVNQGHVLLIPKEHHKNIFDMPKKTFAEISPAIKKLAEAVRSGASADGINIIMNNELAAGQLVGHAHIHIIPRYTNDGFAHWRGNSPYAEGEAEKMAEKIKSNMV